MPDSVLSSWAILRRGARVLGVALPFVVPFTYGPSAAAAQWFVGAASLVLLFLVTETYRAWPGIWMSVLALGALLAWRAGVNAQPAIYACVGLVLLAGATLLGGTGHAGDEDSESLLDGILVAGLLSAIIGLVQYAGVSARFSGWMVQGVEGQAWGNLRQRNQLATLLAAASGALIAGRCWRCGSTEMPQHRKWFVMMSATLLGVALAATSSRIGLVQMLLTVPCLAVLGALRAPMVRRALMCWMGGYGFMLSASYLSAGPASNGALALSRIGLGVDGCSSRVLLWGNVAELIAERPWLGWGWGELSWAHFSHAFSTERFCEILDNAHNLPLHLAVELGLPLAIVVSLGILAWLVCAMPGAKATPGLGAMAMVLLMVAIHSLVEYPLWYAPFLLMTGMCAGALAASARARPGVILGGGVRLAIGVVLLSVLGAVGIAYRAASQPYLPPAQRDATQSFSDASWVRFWFGQYLEFASIESETHRPNESKVRAFAERVLHFSPEPRVIELLLETMSNPNDTHARTQLQDEYMRAFPLQFEAWRRRQCSDHLPAC